MDTYGPLKRYIQTMFEIETDFCLWRSIVEKSVLEFEGELDMDYELFSSNFCVYGIGDIYNSRLLNTYTGESKNIKVKDIKKLQTAFFRWVMNLSILRAYNAIEIFISFALFEQYMGGEITSIQFKELSKKMNEEIKSYFESNKLGRFDTKNNHHIIKYLRHKSHFINIFLNQKIRHDLKTNWASFFEFISILRNVVAHNAMMLSQDTLKRINSSSKDVYERYFSNELIEGDAFLLSPDQDQFSNVLMFMNEFSINLVGIIKQQDKFQFKSFVRK